MRKQLAVVVAVPGVRVERGRPAALPFRYPLALLTEAAAAARLGKRVVQLGGARGKPGSAASLAGVLVMECACNTAALHAHTSAVACVAHLRGLHPL